LDITVFQEEYFKKPEIKIHFNGAV
jgi:hypothetical protein